MTTDQPTGGSTGDHAAEPTYETIRVRRDDDGLATLVLARPDKRNAMTLRMFDEVGDAAERLAADEAVRAVLVTGDGPAFCAGIDLTELASLAAAGGDPDTLLGFAARAQRPYRLLAALPVPTVAAIRGHALGAGLQLALACDLRLAAAGAKLGLLEQRYGIFPDLGGIHHLVREIGPQRTKDLVWSARTVEADEADRMGILLRVVDAAALDGEATALARSVAAAAPIPTRLSKALIGGALDRTLEEELDAEARAQLECLGSADHAEAVAAFFERRPPRFTGRA